MRVHPEQVATLTNFSGVLSGLFCPSSPVIVEIPHFGSMRGKERELIVLRSDNGDTWKEHQSDVKPEDLADLLTGMDEGKGKVNDHSHP